MSGYILTVFLFESKGLINVITCGNFKNFASWPPFPGNWWIWPLLDILSQAHIFFRALAARKFLILEVKFNNGMLITVF